MKTREGGIWTRNKVVKFGNSILKNIEILKLEDLNIFKIDHSVFIELSFYQQIISIFMKIVEKRYIYR